MQIGEGGIPQTHPEPPNLSPGVYVQGTRGPAYFNGQQAPLAPGSGSAIAGFIISGSSPKQILIRGLGSSLRDFQIANGLQNPILDLHDSGGNLIASNDDWQSAANADQIPISLQPSDSHESV